MDGTGSFFPKLLPVLVSCSLLVACSFDYGERGDEDTGLPDIVMNDVEYVRMRDGDPQVRFRAERAERYEERQLMELRNFSFEQFTGHGANIDSSGHAAAAWVELDSGNIGISGGVSLSVDSEDITIETESISWQDEEHELSAGSDEVVRIYRDDGTNFQGSGFRATTRDRRWEFSGSIGGVYVDEDDDDTGDEEEGGVVEAVEERGIWETVDMPGLEFWQ
jgi:LPS export ABC transporter protein LptC